MRASRACVLVEIPTLTNMSVTGWTLGAPKGSTVKVSKTYRYTVGKLGPDVRLRLSYEHGPAELVDVKPTNPAPTVEAPRAIKLEALENKAWAMTARCDEE